MLHSVQNYLVRHNINWVVILIAVIFVGIFISMLVELPDIVSSFLAGFRDGAGN